MASTRPRRDVFRFVRLSKPGPGQAAAGEPQTPEPATVIDFPTQVRR